VVVGEKKSMKRLRRQLPFLRSVLKEANRFKRQELLQHANADQVNAISELVLNLLKNSIPVTPPIMAQLCPSKKVLRNLGRRQHSVKKNVVSGWSRKKAEACGKDSTTCYVNVLENNAKPFNVGQPFAMGNERSGKRVVITGSINISCCIGSICISYPVHVVRGRRTLCRV